MDPVSQGRWIERVPRLRGWMAGAGAATFVVALGAASPGGGPGAALQGPAGISPQALAQIDALLRDKASWTPVQQKIDSQLIFAERTARGQAVTANIAQLETNLPYDPDGRVVLDVRAEVNDALLARLRGLGAEIVQAEAAYRDVRLRVSLDRVEEIAALPQVIFVQPKQEALTNARPTAELRVARTSAVDRERRRRLDRGAMAAMVRDALQKRPPVVTNAGSKQSEGDNTHRAAEARSLFGVDGTGVKIGVLSDGVVGLSTSQASGDLGPVTVLAGQAGPTTTGSSEGTAMLEIVHDIAPGAQLFFATAFNGLSSFAQNIRDLRAAGCDIIVDDVGYFVETPFQDGQDLTVISTTNAGVVSQAVKDVVAAGALYFSSASNSGNLDDGTSGTWEGDFADGGATAPPVEGGRLHRFGAQTFNVINTVGSANTLYWSDPLGGSANDYDLFRLDSTGTSVLAAGVNLQTGTQDPYEQISAGSSGNRLVIVKYAGAGRFLHLGTLRGRLSIATAGETHGHAATSAPNSFGVAATPARSPGPDPNPFTSANVVETFSSDGPRRIFYQSNGTPITAGNVSSTGGQLLNKPDFTAADRVSVTANGGFSSPFSGTSAAAPHAAAIAGLIKSANLGLSAGEIRTLLMNSAIDIEAPGLDRDSGVGIIMALSSVAAATGVASPAITVPPLSQAIAPGASTTLTVSAAGTGSLSYQWYQGSSPVTTTPVGTNASSFTTPALFATTTYWVRVSSTFGSASSTTATVAVGPLITTQPAGTTIGSGQTGALSVVALGTGLSYQWYQGFSSSTFSPVGTNSPNFTTPVLTFSTSYWVRVTNASGSADSNTATVVVGTAPTISTQPQSVGVLSGQSVTLGVVAAGSAPLSYQWYQGTSPNTATPVGANAASLTTPPIGGATSYWVRVSNVAGSVNSTTAAVTVGTAPAITTLPSPASIACGQSTALTVVASGSAPLSYQWYAGTSPSRTTPVGGATGSTLTVSPATTTGYWVRVSNPYDATSSTTTTVTVTAGPGCASYDATLKVPKCGAVGSLCDAAGLLIGRDNIFGGSEPNQPNTINGSCSDGTSGAFHVDESLDGLRVSTVDGTPFAPGKLVRVEATVWAFSSTSDHLDLYYTADPTNPAWTLFATLTPPATGAQTLSATYALPSGSLQAVRAVLRYQGSAAACGTNSGYDDHDDLVFAVGAPEIGSAVYDPTLKAPRCSVVGTFCDSNDLLGGRDNMSGGPEPNQPNTILNSCTDGTAGVFHSDQSNDRIRVSTLDGRAFAAGKTVRIDATVWTFSTGSDRLDLYSAADAANPNWTFIATLTPPSTGAQTLSTIYTLPSGTLQAVRARFRSFGSAVPCGTGSFNDHDDLIFGVNPPSGTEMVQNGSFTGGLTNWGLFEVPDIVHNGAAGGEFRYHKANPTTTASGQAVIYQETGVSVGAGTPLTAQFDIGNDDAARKRISVLVIDSNFSDLSVCTFWLPPGAPLRTYQMKTHPTKAWASAAIYFYAASTGTGDYRLDNVSLKPDAAGLATRTDCVDPTVPAATSDGPGPNLLLNGDFSGGLPPWGAFFDIVHNNAAGGVFEFIRPGTPGQPAGGVLQSTNQALAANQIVTASFQLGNSSTVRKRVTILLHDLDFSDLSACTFWLSPGQALSAYTMRMFATKAWTNATLSLYAATTGSEPYTRLDNVTLQRTSGTTTSGTECVEPTVLFEFSQQGSKLLGSGAVGAANQGRAVALSADGNTALVGGNSDSSGAGAAWVWTRTGDSWTQQGAKLVGSGAVGNAVQGTSVSLSADGNTALVGGASDNSNAGAAWVWTRSAGVWTQQGSKLVGSGAVGSAAQGYSVSLSADGNTALVGGHSDNGSAGAVWIWTRSGGVWTQQGAKLVGAGAVGSASQGHSVSLSADGNTAIVGGSSDNGGVGAAWTWTRSGGVWTQQGSKLVGAGAAGNANQGQSVSISGDGNTAVVGGNADNGGAGATWVWTRIGGVWSQQGAKLVASDANGAALLGVSAAISGDGNTAIVGGYQDSGNAGAAWVWTRNGGVWTQQGTKLLGSAAVGPAFQGLSVSLSADGSTAIVGGSQDNSGVGAAWVFAAVALGPTGSRAFVSGSSPLAVVMPRAQNTREWPATASAGFVDSGVAGWSARGGFTTSPETSSGGAGSAWRADAAVSGRAILSWAHPVDLTYARSARLTFASWLSSRTSTGDVQVSADGVSWQTVSAVPRSEGWTTIDVDLTAFAGQVVYLRFVFEAVAPGIGVTPDVWWIDDVSVAIGGRRADEAVRPPT